MNSSYLLSVIISTKHTPSYILEKTLSNILENVFEHMEIIIVDQNEDRRMESVVKRCAEKNTRCSVSYISSNELGLSRGRNRGFKQTAGTWVLFFDDDAFLENQTFEQCVTYLKEYQDKEQVLYGRVKAIETGKNYLSRAVATRRLHVLNFDSVCSIGLIFNRKVLEKAGLFDEQFGVGAHYGAGEESDLILRIKAKNIPIIFLPSFIVYHAQATPDPEKSFKYGFGIGAVYRKHIFKSLIFFSCLSLRLISEILIREFLNIGMYLKSDKIGAKAHQAYVKGFWKGFITYEHS